MKIININGPINSGKSTVSKILVNLLPKAAFIEVDELLSDKEQISLKLDFKAGIAERLKRLETEVKKHIASNNYDYIIFAYPMNVRNYNLWKNMVEDSSLVCITLSPSMENCLKNRGTRELTAFEISRIKEMYCQEYHCPPNADLIIYNDNQTPEQTAQEIYDFLCEFYRSNPEFEV